MWLTQMFRTPPPPPKQFTWNWAYSLSSQWSSQWQLEVLSEDLCPFFSHVYGPSGKVFLPPVTGSPTWTSRVHRSALNAHRIHKFSYLCPFTILFRIGNQITLLCFENFILFTKSVKMVLSAKDQLLLLSLLNVTTNFIIVGKVTCADEI